ncbi:MAG TPA: low temperature requirement protein A [Mycobacteriales bacterium]|nr:low temperature requirement protein A [Mycobacteriales bacterium]
MQRPTRFLPKATEEQHQVTTIELFFDLVFVFAITQVTALVAADLTARGVLRGFVLLALLWWCWCSYAWLGNQARADEGVVRGAVVAAMAALFLVGLAVPEAWGDTGGGFHTPLALALALAFVRLLHLSVYAVAAASDAALRRQLARAAVPVGLASVLLVTGALIGDSAQTALWIAAIVIDYGGIYLTDDDGWRLPAPGHFAERHGLIVLIALGESIVATGLGLGSNPLTWPVVAAAMLGLAVTVALWWSYFDVVALVAERVLAGLSGRERTRLARDSYTYLHFPMVAGIIFLAVGLKKVLSYAAGDSSHALSDSLPALGTAVLYAGPLAYLLAHVAFRYRNVRSISRPRLVVCLLLPVVAVFAAQAPALVALGLLAALLVGLICFEAITYAEARRKVRSTGAPHRQP